MLIKSICKNNFELKNDIQKSNLQIFKKEKCILLCIGNIYKNKGCYILTSTTLNIQVITFFHFKSAQKIIQV